MKIKLQTWTVEKLLREWSKIDPKPQYQRTPVWSIGKKQLLLDSMLRGFDIPKFYLNRTKKGLHPYEVTDGQQRMRAIHEFFTRDDGFRLGLTVIGKADVNGMCGADLKAAYPKLHNAMLKYPLHMTIVEEASAEEVRALFARLQMGERLNPVELRHALASNLGNAIYALAENHPFFKESGIPNKRYKHQDYLDHAIAICSYDGQRNLKAPDLRAIYADKADSTMADLQPMLGKCNKVLDLMRKMNAHKKGMFRNKWGFLDTFFLLFKYLDAYSDIRPKLFCEAFMSFEAQRRTHNAQPEGLIEDKSSMSYDKDLYDYILAFRQHGAEKKNYLIRHRVFHSRFFRKELFVMKPAKS